MSLSARLSAFFLATLAVVLLGFSAGLYLLARAYLGRQVEERLVSALDTLAAAVEDEEGLEWEPRDRHLALGEDAAADQVRWAVHDGEGRLVDRSANLGPGDPLSDGGPASPSWQLARRRLEAPGNHAGPGRHTALVLTAGLPLGPVQATLSTLAWTSAGLSAVLWLAAALAGRWICRRALVPVTRMAAAARAMDAADLRQRLPSPGTADELEDLRGAFNDLLGRVEDALRRQRRFTGDASHQLRTPLTAMLGQVEVALRRDRQVEDYRRVLGRVHGQAVHLRRIVEALLFLARADADADLPGLEVLDLAAWLPGQLTAWSGHARAADLSEVIREALGSPGGATGRSPGRVFEPGEPGGDGNGLSPGGATGRSPGRVGEPGEPGGDGNGLSPGGATGRSPGRVFEPGVKGAAVGEESPAGATEADPVPGSAAPPGLKPDPPSPQSPGSKTRPGLRPDAPPGLTTAHPDSLSAGAVPTGPLWVRAQPLLLGQLLENLVDNAFKYSEPCTPVVVSLAAEAGAVTLTVEDAGCGIAPEDLPHVFEPFYRSAASRRLGRGGVGLGLAMVQRIATAFGGSVTATSEPGRGSRFVLRLPRVPAAAAVGTPVAPEIAGR